MDESKKPEIQFLKNRPTVEVERGANLMQALLTAGLPVASSCRGDGVCAKCRIRIYAGAQNLSVQNETEKFLRDRHNLEGNERVSCQTEVLGNITVDTGYW